MRVAAKVMPYLFLLVFDGIFIVVSIWGYRFFGPEGYQARVVTYGRLQAIESSFREKELKTPYVLELEGGYRALALRTGIRQFPYAWIVLTQEHSASADGVFTMGWSDSPEISCEQLDVVQTKVKLAKKVALFLKRRCQGEHARRGVRSGIPSSD